MKKNFDQLTHLGQTRRLRLLAEQVLKNYSIGSYKLVFINHGENTTYKVLTKKKNFLLRIHCISHRTEAAIKEELKWLDHLSRNSDIPVQKPIKAKNGKMILKLYHEEIGQKRLCDLLEWQDGQIRNKKSKKIFIKVGELIGELQNNSIKSKHRHYWYAQGLLGEKTSLGDFRDFKRDFPKQYPVIESLRKETFKELQKYEKKNPHRISMIHSDLHFGNMVWEKGVVKPIDFDDCGIGFEMNDLAVNLNGSSRYFDRIGKKETKISKNALLEGYANKRELTQADIDIIPYLVASRELLMMTWLSDRRDNPWLWEYLNKNLSVKIKKAKAYIKWLRN